MTSKKKPAAPAAHPTPSPAWPPSEAFVELLCATADDLAGVAEYHISAVGMLDVHIAAADAFGTEGPVVAFRRAGEPPNTTHTIDANGCLLLERIFAALGAALRRSGA